jgi:hypothetical protein
VPGAIDLGNANDFGEVLEGDPVFDPPPRVIREVEFGAPNGPCPKAALPDFVL